MAPLAPQRDHVHRRRDSSDIGTGFSDDGSGDVPVQSPDLWEEPSAELYSHGADDGAGTMSEHRVSFLQTILSNERGQVLPLVALMLVVLLGFTGLVVDVGHAYVANQQLQGSTDAAALAASGALPDNTAATKAAQTYGAATIGGVAGYNAVTSLTTSHSMTTCVQVSVKSGACMHNSCKCERRDGSNARRRAKLIPPLVSCWASRLLR